jgi:hypothetical protein
VEVEETRLPGIGLRHDFVTALGRRVGVVSQRNGVRHVVLYDEEDDDACAATVELTADESEILAELLGAPRITERFARLRESLEGLATEACPSPPAPPSPTGRWATRPSAPAPAHPWWRCWAVRRCSPRRLRISGSGSVTGSS